MKLINSIFGIILTFFCTFTFSASEKVIGLTFTLEDGIRKGGYAEIPFDLFINAVKKGDKWTVMSGQGFENKGLGWGTVESAEITESNVAITVSFLQNTDPYTPGGRAVYNINCTRSPDGSLNGSYDGIYYGENYTFWYNRKITEEDKYNESDISPPKGGVTGSLFESQTPYSDWKPVQNKEHPRILFTANELPVLYSKSQTEFGKKCIQKMDMNSAVTHGILYQLAAYGGNETKAASHAEKAKEILIEMFSDFSGGVDEHGKIGFWQRLEQSALAFDLCYHAWDLEFRKQVAWYMVNSSKIIMDFQGEFRGGEFSWDITAYGGGLFMGPGFAGLALAGEDYPPVNLFPWFADGQKTPTISPPENLEIPEGMPVTQLKFRETDDISLINEPGESGAFKMPEYLMVKGFKVEKDQILAPFGGNADIRPQPGETVNFQGISDTWKPVPEEYKSTPAHFGRTVEAYDLAKLTERKGYTTVYLYAIIENDSPRWIEYQPSIFVQVASSPLESAMYINGIRRNPGDFAYLEAGTHSVLVAIPTFHFQPWGAMNYAPRIVEPSEERRTRNLEYFEFEQQERQEFVQYAEKAYGFTGNPYFNMMLHRGAGSLSTYFQSWRDEKGGTFPQNHARAYLNNLVGRFGRGIQRVINIPANPHWDMSSRILSFYSKEPPTTELSYGSRTPNYPLYLHLFDLLPPAFKQEPAGKALLRQPFDITDDAQADLLIEQDPVYALILYPQDVTAGSIKESRLNKNNQKGFSLGINGDWIEFRIPQNDLVQILTLDSKGRQLGTVFKETVNKGFHRIKIGQNRLSSQAMILKLETGDGKSLLAKLK